MTSKWPQRRNQAPATSPTAKQAASFRTPSRMPTAGLTSSDGTKDTTIDSAAWLFSAQRRAGLWISTAVDSLQGLEETGKGDADDYFGDSLANKSKHHRTHHAALRGWYDATAAVATAPVVLGDKDNEARTRQFCAS